MLTLLMIYLIGFAITYIISRVSGGSSIWGHIKYALLWPKWLFLTLGLLLYAIMMGRNWRGSQ